MAEQARVSEPGASPAGPPARWRRWRRARRLVPLSVAVWGATTTGLPGVGAGPAGAAIAGLDLATAIGGENSGTAGALTSQCRGDRVIIGGGAQVAGAEPDVVLTRLQPEADGLGNTDVMIAESGEAPPGTGGTHRMTVQALCATPTPALAWEIRNAPSAVTSDPSMAATVTCPTGKSVLSVGADVEPTSGTDHHRFTINRMQVNLGGQSAGATASEEPAGFAGTWRLRVYAVCATTPAGYEIVPVTSTELPTANVKTATRECPPGKRVISAGGFINNTVTPGTGLRSALISGGARFSASAVNTSADGRSWGSLTSFGICVTA